MSDRRAELKEAAIKAGCEAILSVRTIHRVSRDGREQFLPERRADEEAVGRFVEAIVALMGDL